ncbi:MAG: hypothetical protein K2M57_04965, partial [Paramuribaculum sp.]|nr:hypothetical protein [Paramuribaculum sp.]
IHIEGESGPEKKSAAKVERKGKEASAEKPKAKRSPAVRKLEAIVWPECGQGHILKGRSAYGCSRYREGCGLRLPFEQYSAELTPGKLNTAIKKNYKKHG